MSTEELLRHQDEACVTLALNRPDALNALTSPMRQSLLEELRRADQDPGVRCVVLRGTGRAFCVGQDLKELQDYYETHGPELGRLVEDEYIPIVKVLRELSKPTIAVLDGPAVGGGMALALATDFRVIGARARLVPAFVNVGLAPDTGATFLLARSIGYARALSLCLTGQPLEAEQLVAFGLAAQVNESSQTLEQALQDLTKRLCDGPTRAYAAIRRLFDQAVALPLDDVLALERDVQNRLSHTRDHGAAVESFLNRRAAQFQGQ